MLVKTTITEKREIKKNITLPYYSKDHDTFYRINEDESILRITVSDRFCGMSLSKRGEFFESMFLESAAAAQECSPEEVEQAAKQYLEFVHETINDLAESV